MKDDLVVGLAPANPVITMTTRGCKILMLPEAK
jgi:hypothetical protein